MKIGETMFHNPKMRGFDNIIVDSGSTITDLPFSQIVLLKNELMRLCQHHPQCLQTKGTSEVIFHLID